MTPSSGSSRARSSRPRADQGGVDALVDPVVAADHRDDLVSGQWGEDDAAKHTGAKHRLSGEDFPAAVAADEQHAAAALGALAEVAQEFDAFPVQVLGLVDHDQAWRRGELGLEDPGDLEPVGVAVRAADYGEQVGGDETHLGWEGKDNHSDAHSPAKASTARSTALPHDQI